MTERRAPVSIRFAPGPELRLSAEQLKALARLVAVKLADQLADRQAGPGPDEERNGDAGEADDG
jgi:hypothetical protein